MRAKEVCASSPTPPPRTVTRSRAPEASYRASPPSWPQSQPSSRSRSSRKRAVSSSGVSARLRVSAAGAWSVKAAPRPSSPRYSVPMSGSSPPTQGARAAFHPPPWPRSSPVRGPALGGLHPGTVHAVSLGGPIRLPDAAGPMASPAASTQQAASIPHRYRWGARPAGAGPSPSVSAVSRAWSDGDTPCRSIYFLY